jgi:hypothetical protein
MKKSWVVLFLICVVSFNSCKKEEEEVEREEINIGNFSLLESSGDSFPYQGKSGMIYVDSANNEVVGAIVQEYKGLGSQGRMVRDLSEVEKLARYQTEQNTVDIFLPDFNRTVRVKMSVQLDDFNRYPTNIKLADVISIISYRQRESYTIEDNIEIIVNKRSSTRSNDQFNQVISTLDLNGKTFNNVYSDQNNEMFVAYFTLEQGLVGFTDKEQNITYTIK